MPETSEVPTAINRRRLVLIALVVAIVTATLVVFGLERTPNYTFNLVGVNGVNAISVKSKIATGILGLALLQLLLALWMYGKIPRLGAATRPVRRVHRAMGALLFLATLPVAIPACLATAFRPIPHE